MSPIHSYNFNNINNSSVNNLPETEKDAEMPIDELSRLNLGNLQESGKNADSSQTLLESLLRIQQVLLEITKIVVLPQPLSDGLLQEIEKTVKILHQRRGILISELKKRGEL